jgi:hypothetical protein
MYSKKGIFMKKQDDLSTLIQEQRIQKISENTQDVPTIAHILSNICDMLWVIVILLIINLFV